MHRCTNLPRFALVSMAFPERYAKKYTGHCIIACVPMWICFTVLIEFSRRGCTACSGGVRLTLGGCKSASFISLWPIESVEKSLGALNLNLTAIPKAYKTYLLLEILFEP